MIKLNFKQWLEVFGQGIEPPVQDPEKLNNGAFPRYSLPKENPVKPGKIPHKIQNIPKN
jgi:hypothetical protein